MDLPDLVHKVQAYTHQRLPQYLTDLRELCSIDTGSYYKPGLDQAASWLAERMFRLNMDVNVVKNAEWGNDLEGTIKGRGKGRILLLGHTDTVYPVGTAAARPMHIDNDMIYGPGVCDMKGCILSALYALEALLVNQQDSFDEIRFLCVSDEEITTRHSKDIMRKAYAQSDTVLVLEAARPNGDIVSTRKGVAWYTLTARGRAAHAGVEIEKGRNSIVEVAHQILQFLSLDHLPEGVTINPGVISGGTSPNVVPDYAQVSFDIRYLRTKDRFEVEKCWRDMLRRQKIPGIELTLEAAPDCQEPMECTRESLKMVRFAQYISGMLGFSLNAAATGGGSDANDVSAYGLPVLDGLGPIGGLDHSPDEYIRKSSIAPRTALLGGMIVGLGRQLLSSADSQELMQV